MITARETLTYEALKSKGIKNNVVLCSDPAFQLDCEKVELPNGFIEGNTIGINISPLINNYSNSELILNNYKMLIDYIIKNTNFNIVLIPHVVKDGNDDINSLKKLYDEFKASKRMIIISDCNCMQLKECISKCRMFIGARTHATIASYSTCVPTLVVGYSVKARGIARDIFGKDENYVIPVQSLKGEKDLQNAFIWLMNNEDRIRKYLIDFMPEYKNRTYLAKEALDKLYK